MARILPANYVYVPHYISNHKEDEPENVPLLHSAGPYRNLAPILTVAALQKHVVSYILFVGSGARPAHNVEQ
jgi:hypothetical protein